MTGESTGAAAAAVSAATAMTGRAGRIAVGARADLTVVAVDPVRANADELAHAPIALSVVDGTVVHRGSLVDA